jgi:catalase (peroxidase I)
VKIFVSPHTTSQSIKVCNAAGLATAVNLLEPIKKKFPLISYADLFQLASATAVESVRTLWS